MRECAKCHTRTDLKVNSVTAQALKSIMSNPRAQSVYVAAPAHACLVCRRAQGTYSKNSGRIPVLPIEGCSCADGCTCRYEPLVIEVGP